MPKVSVIIPAYNCDRYLNESVTSALSQTFKDIEIIVVDDGSTDSTPDLMSVYSGRPEVSYVRIEHSGLPAARNSGIEHSSGDYIAFLDADDIFCEDKIEKAMDLFNKNKKADVFYGAWKYFYDGNKEGAFPSTYFGFSGDLLFFLKRSNFIHISTAVVRRCAIGSARFDTSLKSHEDWDFWLSLSEKGAKFLYAEEYLSFVRVRRTSMTAAKDVMDASRSVVGNRAKGMWKRLKHGMSLNSIDGARSILRYIYLRARAFLLGFPGSRKFNVTIPFWR